jgi:hypothetical protein
MGTIFHPLLFLLARSTADDLQKQVEFLKAENEMLRKRVPKKRISLKADERAKLLKLGKGLGPAIRHLLPVKNSLRNVARESAFEKFLCSRDLLSSSPFRSAESESNRCETRALRLTAM